MKRSTLTPLSKPGKRIGSPVKDEAEHFYVCQTCGQAVDARDLAQVFYHDEEGHRRLGSDG